MLVVLTKNHLLLPQQVCPTCLLANQQGQPRWQQGQLRCGYPIAKTIDTQPDQYQCQMGFRIAVVH